MSCAARSREQVIEEYLQATPDFGAGKAVCLLSVIHANAMEIEIPKRLRQTSMAEGQSRAKTTRRPHRMAEAAHRINDPVKVVIGKREADEEHVPRHQKRLHDSR